MKILLSGSSGFLGKHIIEKLKPTNKISSLNRSGAHFNLDISKKIILPQNDFETVIHAAANTNLNHQSNEVLFNTNVTGTKNLLNALQYNENLKSFIFISSVAVYGLIEGELINENSPLLAKDPYGESKKIGEELVQEWCYKHNINITILRLPLLVGPNPPGNLGAMISGIQKGYYFNINHGTAKKSMVLAKDVANYILKAAEKGGIYNLTDGYHPSYLEISNLIATQLGKRKIFNLPISIAKIISKIGDLGGDYAPLNSIKLKKLTSSLTFCDLKAKEAFGWNPTKVLDGLKIN